MSKNTSDSGLKELNEHQLKSDAMLRQSHDISQQIAKDKKQMSIETGQSVLLCDEKVHDLVLFISQQLGQANHPVRVAIEKFKTFFMEANMVLLCRQVDQEVNEPLVEVSMDKKMDYAEFVISKVINMFQELVLIFYELDEKITKFDRTFELFENIVTNLILEGQVYFLMFNLTSSWLEP